MKRLGIVLGVTTVLVTLCSPVTGHAATRVRSRAETVLNDAAVRISGGTGHTCQVNEDGTVRCWGANNVGQLGNGTLGDGTAANAPTRVPVLVSGLTTAVSVTAGANHTCALLADGTVRCWGSNSSGQIGDNALVNRLTPAVVSGLTSAVAVVAGGSHTCALLASGTVRCWGANLSGQLGVGTFETRRLTPTETVRNLTNAVALAAGGGFTCALLANGTVRCWGANGFGELGIGSTVPSSTPVAVTPLTRVAALASGFHHTCAVLADGGGTVRCWGRNDSGQLGDGTTTTRLSPVNVLPLSNVVALAAGVNHTCALLADGTTQCWGLNGNGEIGDGTRTRRPTPVRAGTSLLPLINTVAITGGSAHSCALLADGSAKCWGANQSGQLGISNTAPRNLAPTPVLGGGGSVTARDVAAGRSHTCAVRANGTVACWGSNDSGQLGDGTTTTRLSPVTVSGLSEAVAIAAGEAHTCALVANGTARCWGDNNQGQLGDGTTTDRLTPVAVPTSRIVNAVAIAAGGALGSSHTCALLASGTVMCWGANGSGQVGNGTTAQQNFPVPVLGSAVSIAVGEFHTCALAAIGVPFCWGFNGSGRLGDGTLTNRTVPTLVSLDNTVAIAGGNTHTCALRADGTAWCWGANLLGQLGINSTAARLVPTFVNLSNVIAIAGGFGHTCALLPAAGITTGAAGAFCWGDNGVGQLGSASTASSPVPVAMATCRTLNIIGGGSSRICSTVGRIANVTTGRRHSCLLSSTGAILCTGDNSAGQLGINSTTNQPNPVSALSFTLNIDPSVLLKHKNRTSTVTILANCEVGQRLSVDVTLTQGALSERASGRGKCTGGLGRFPVRVHTQGRQRFVEGPAVVTAEGVIREGGKRGSIVETQEWTRNVQIVIAPRHDHHDRDEDDDDRDDDDRDEHARHEHDRHEDRRW